MPKGIYKRTKPGWNKGMKGIYKDSEETKRKKSLSHIGMNTWSKGRKLPKEVCEKIRIATIGEKNPFYGKHHTEESKKKMSVALKGKSSPMKGKKHSDESKKNMSEGLRRFFLNNPDALTRMAIKATGRKQSQETIQKRNTKNTGRKRTLEQRLRIKAKVPRGEKCHFWKGGVSTENHKLRRGFEFRVWRESVFKRDDWTCQECKTKGGELHPHHIKSFAKYPELRFVVENGVTLCKGCHKLTDTYGVNI